MIHFENMNPFLHKYTETHGRTYYLSYNHRVCFNKDRKRSWPELTSGKDAEQVQNKSFVFLFLFNVVIKQMSNGYLKTRM